MSHQHGWQAATLVLSRTADRRPHPAGLAGPPARPQRDLRPVWFLGEEREDPLPERAQPDHEARGHGHAGDVREADRADPPQRPGAHRALQLLQEPQRRLGPGHAATRPRARRTAVWTYGSMSAWRRAHSR